MAIERQDQKQRVFGHADGRALGREGDGDPGAAAGIDVDVVVSHSLMLHKAQARRGLHQVGIDTGGGGQQKISVRHMPKQFASILAGDNLEPKASGQQIGGEGEQIIRNRFAIDMAVSTDQRTTRWTG